MCRTQNTCRSFIGLNTSVKCSSRVLRFSVDLQGCTCEERRVRPYLQSHASHKKSKQLERQKQQHRVNAFSVSQHPRVWTAVAASRKWGQSGGGNHQTNCSRAFVVLSIAESCNRPNVRETWDRHDLRPGRYAANKPLEPTAALVNDRNGRVVGFDARSPR